MSSTTDRAVAAFGIRNIAFFQSTRQAEGDPLWEPLFDMLQEESEDPVTLNGWEIWNYDESPAGGTSPLVKGYVGFEFFATKGDFEVSLLNESEYARGDVYDFTACAIDQASLEEFARDFGLKLPIEGPIGLTATY